MANYLDLSGLEAYNEKIKSYIDSHGAGIEDTVSGSGNAITDIAVNSSTGRIAVSKAAIFVRADDIAESGSGNAITDIIINTSMLGNGPSNGSYAITIMRGDAPAGMEAITGAEINALFE